MMQVFALAISDSLSSLKTKTWPLSVSFPIIYDPASCRDALSGDGIVFESTVCYIWFH